MELPAKLFRERLRIANLSQYPRANPFVATHISVWPTANPEQSRKISVVRDNPISDAPSEDLLRLWLSRLLTWARTTRGS